jgi:hypothetical protein
MPSVGCSAASRWMPLPTLIVHPLRPGRFEPRVRKRRFTKYPVMKRPRDELRKVLLKKELAA